MTAEIFLKVGLTQILIILSILFLYLYVRPALERMFKKKNIEGFFLLSDTFITVTAYFFLKQTIEDHVNMDLKEEFFLLLLFLLLFFILDRLAKVLQRFKPVKKK